MTVLNLDQPAQPDLIYHYTNALNAAAILDSGVIRFSTLDRMNDPRENEDYLFGARYLVDDMSTEEFRRRLGVISKLVMSSVRVACFTVDDLRPPEDAAGHGRRGYGRARNWDQYAGRHTGCVLALNRSVLERELGVRVVDAVAENVDYSDVQRDMSPDGVQFGFSQGQLDLDQLEKTAQDLMSPQYRRQFFLTKFEDWSSEREFRLLAFTRDPVELPIAEAFAGIVLGSSFPPAESNVLGVRLLRLGIKETVVGQMVWTNGAIGARPVGQELRNFETTGSETINGLVVPSAARN